MALLNVCPPRAPKSTIGDPSAQAAAWETLSPAWSAVPVIKPRLLMPSPAPLTPPSVGSGIILYTTCVACAVTRTGAIANAASTAIPAMHTDILNFMLPPIGLLSKPRDRDACLLSSVAPWLKRGSAKKEQTESEDAPQNPRQNRAMRETTLDVCGRDIGRDGWDGSHNSRNSSRSVEILFFLPYSASHSKFRPPSLVMDERGAFTMTNPGSSALWILNSLLNGGGLLAAAHVWNSRYLHKYNRLFWLIPSILVAAWLEPFFSALSIVQVAATLHFPILSRAGAQTLLPT